MTVNFEMEFDSSTGAFTAFGLVDAQRCVKASGTNARTARAHAAARLLKYLKSSQPVVGLLLPPPDRKSLFYNHPVGFRNPQFIIYKSFLHMVCLISDNARFIPLSKLIV